MGSEGKFLLLFGGLLFVGTLLAFWAHLRLLNTIYPLWILLGINAVIATVGGTVASFGGLREEAEWSVSDDSVVVPASVWEEVQRRLSELPPASRPDPRLRSTSTIPSAVVKTAPSPATPTPLASTAPADPPRPMPATPPTVDTGPAWSEANEGPPSQLLADATLESITQELEALAREVSANVAPIRPATPTPGGPEKKVEPAAMPAKSSPPVVPASIVIAPDRAVKTPVVEAGSTAPPPHRGPVAGRCGSCGVTLGPTSVDAQCDTCGKPMCWKCARMAEVQDTPGRCSSCVTRQTGEWPGRARPAA